MVIFTYRIGMKDASRTITFEDFLVNRKKITDTKTIINNGLIMMTNLTTQRR